MFTHLKAGDKVTRLLAGSVKMSMVVRDVTPTLITCDALNDAGEIACLGGWTFCPITGAEIDDELGWGPKYGVTGSKLVK